MKGNLLDALGHVVPSHLLDRDLQRALAATSGADPWLDAEDEEACSPEELLTLASPPVSKEGEVAASPSSLSKGPSGRRP